MLSHMPASDPRCVGKGFGAGEDRRTCDRLGAFWPGKQALFLLIAAAPAVEKMRRG